jgi:hypothetical protein
VGSSQRESDVLVRWNGNVADDARERRRKGAAEGTGLRRGRSYDTAAALG